MGDPVTVTTRIPGQADPVTMNLPESIANPPPPPPLVEQPLPSPLRDSVAKQPANPSGVLNRLMERLEARRGQSVDQLAGAVRDELRASVELRTDLGRRSEQEVRASLARALGVPPGDRRVGELVGVLRHQILQQITQGVRQQVEQQLQGLERRLAQPDSRQARLIHEMLAGSGRDESLRLFRQMGASGGAVHRAEQAFASGTPTARSNSVAELMHQMAETVGAERARIGREGISPDEMFLTYPAQARAVAAAHFRGAGRDSLVASVWVQGAERALSHDASHRIVEGLAFDALTLATGYLGAGHGVGAAEVLEWLMHGGVEASAHDNLNPAHHRARSAAMAAIASGGGFGQAHRLAEQSDRSAWISGLSAVAGFSPLGIVLRAVRPFVDGTVR